MNTIDLTPTWTGILPALIAMIEGAKNAETRNYAIAELRRMAQLADRYIEERK